MGSTTRLFTACVLAVGFVASFGVAAAPASAQAATCDSSSSFHVTTSALPSATEYQPYGVQLEADGGTQAYTFSISQGSLPNGLTMTPTGVITGVPLTPGISNFQVAAKDSANPPGCDTPDLGILVLTSPEDAGGLLGYLGRVANPDCILATVGAVLGQGPSGGACY